MSKAVFEELNNRLTDNKIPSRIVEDGNVLTVLLDESIAGTDIYGDIFYRSFEADDKENGLIVIEWEVMDLKPYPNEVHGNLCVASAMLNSILPLGGYAVRAAEDDSEVKLLYRIVLPIGLMTNEAAAVDILYETLELSSAAIAYTAPQMNKLAKGEIGPDEFFENFEDAEE